MTTAAAVVIEAAVVAGAKGGVGRELYRYIVLFTTTIVYTRTIHYG